MISSLSLSELPSVVSVREGGAGSPTWKAVQLQYHHLSSTTSNPADLQRANGMVSKGG